MPKIHRIALILAMAVTVYAQNHRRHPAVPDRLELKPLTKEMCTGSKALPDGVLPEPQDVAQDAYCADLVVARSAPHGMVTIFGSARLKPGHPVYESVYRFAYAWTKAGGKRWPIATGGGPGVMEAGNKGAHDAGGVSLGFDTPFGVNGVEKPNPYTTDGYHFISFSQRETELIDNARAIVVAAGGAGTGWELFESLSKIQTGKLNRMPLILLGSEAEWAHVTGSLRRLRDEGMIGEKDLELVRVAGPDEAVELILAHAKSQ